MGSWRATLPADLVAARGAVPAHVVNQVVVLDIAIHEVSLTKICSFHETPGPRAPWRRPVVLIAKATAPAQVNTGSLHLIQAASQATPSTAPPGFTCEASLPENKLHYTVVGDRLSVEFLVPGGLRYLDLVRN